MSTVSYPHIEKRSNGTLYIAGTPFKVRQIAIDHLSYGWDAAAIQREHPQLTLGQVHAALSYYYDHQRDLDEEIAAGEALADNLRSQQSTSPLSIRARAHGKDVP
jgi:uncharacterized protein (DUF433 family)